MKSILGPGGKLRGYIRESGDKTELLAPGGRVLGYYIKRDNMTIEPGGKFVGYGNQLMLLMEE